MVSRLTAIFIYLICLLILIELNGIIPPMLNSFLNIGIVVITIIFIKYIRYITTTIESHIKELDELIINQNYQDAIQLAERLAKKEEYAVHFGLQKSIAYACMGDFERFYKNYEEISTHSQHRGYLYNCLEVLKCSVDLLHEKINSINIHINIKKNEEKELLKYGYGTLYQVIKALSQKDYSTAINPALTMTETAQKKYFKFFYCYVLILCYYNLQDTEKAKSYLKNIENLAYTDFLRGKFEEIKEILK